MSDTEPTGGKSGRGGLGTAGVLIALLVVAGVVFFLAWFAVYGKKGVGPSAGLGESPAIRSASEDWAPDTADYEEWEGEEGAEQDASALPRIGASAAAAEAPVERRIIKNGEVELHVADLDASVEHVRKLVEAAGGFVASQSFYAKPGSWRRCSVTVRVPAGDFDRVVGELQKQGDVWRLSISTQDVTEEFIDLEARLRNSEKEEGVLLDLLERRTPKLADVLQVERELSRVRGDIETTQGRLRYLRNKVSLSTIDLELTEIGEAAVGPTGQWRMRFHLVSAGRMLVTAVRGLVTGIIYIAIVGAPVWVVLGIWLGVRRRRK